MIFAGSSLWASVLLSWVHFSSLVTLLFVFMNREVLLDLPFFYLLVADSLSLLGLFSGYDFIEQGVFLRLGIFGVFHVIC